MALGNQEFNQLLQQMGGGKIPVTGGPATALKSPIAQTVPFEVCNTAGTLSSGVMSLSPIFITANQTITSINFVSCAAAESGGTHLWFALYDDGRGSSVAGQLGLLAQTPDQTGAAVFPANSSLGLALQIPFITQYSGIYYIAIMCVATQRPNLAAIGSATSASIQIATSTGAIYGAIAGSGLTTTAPSPSGAVSSSGSIMTTYGYVS